MNNPDLSSLEPRCEWCGSKMFNVRYPANQNYATGNCRNCDGQVKILPLKKTETPPLSR